MSLQRFSKNEFEYYVIESFYFTLANSGRVKICLLNVERMTIVQPTLFFSIWREIHKKPPTFGFGFFRGWVAHSVFLILLHGVQNIVDLTQKMVACACAILCSISVDIQLNCCIQQELHLKIQVFWCHHEFDFYIPTQTNFQLSDIFIFLGLFSK